MLEMLRDTGPNGVVLVAPGEDCAPAWVRELVARAGMVPVVAAVELTGARAALLAELWDAGISEVADLTPRRRPRALGEALRAAHARPFKLRLEAGLSPRVSVNALTLVRAAAELVVDGGTSAGLAARLGARERTVLNWCTREHLPAPKRLMVWLRLALATALLEHPGRSITAAALAAGYSGDHSLRRVLRTELGPAYGSAPRTATFAHVLGRLNAELRVLREAAREARRSRAA
ncbi:MAG TPA: helix-turn-helix domain-containing protein [Longimicrobium sp.]|nr:helix-turn-helix domain-containing protein [Longimicrobium sp.]